MGEGKERATNGIRGGVLRATLTREIGQCWVYIHMLRHARRQWRFNSRLYAAFRRKLSEVGAVSLEYFHKGLLLETRSFRVLWPWDYGNEKPANDRMEGRYQVCAELNLSYVKQETEQKTRGDCARKVVVSPLSGLASPILHTPWSWPYTQRQLHAALKQTTYILALFVADRSEDVVERYARVSCGTEISRSCNVLVIAG